MDISNFLGLRNLGCYIMSAYKFYSMHDDSLIICTPETLVYVGATAHTRTTIHTKALAHTWDFGLHWSFSSYMGQQPTTKATAHTRTTVHTKAIAHTKTSDHTEATVHTEPTAHIRTSVHHCLGKNLWSPN